MALVVKADAERDLGKRRIGTGNLFASGLDAKPPYEFADRAVEVLAPCARQVNGMDADLFGHLLKRNRFVQSRSNDLSYLIEPARYTKVNAFFSGARNFCQYFKR